MRSCYLLAGAVVAFAIASPGAAWGQTYSGGGGLIADDTGPDVTTVFQITVGAGAGIVGTLGDVTLVNLSHSYCGDLGIQLRHNGITVDLVDRIGYPSSGIYGDSSDFGGTYAFSDSSFASIWSAAAAAGSAQAIPSGTYFASRGNGIRVNIAEAFSGLDASGTWDLLVTDYQPDASGLLGSWNFSITTVPAPGALSLLALVGAASRRDRRTRQPRSILRTHAP